MSNPPRALCFVAMPFGKRASAPGEPEIDFDAVYALLQPIVETAGLECVRADFEASGGFIHKPMFERLIVAEFVLADLTFSNPNVTYEVGLRHGASIGATLLVAESKYLAAKKLPFDLAPFRILPYVVGTDGKPDAAACTAFTSALAERLALARRGELPSDNPVVQVTQLRPSTAGHEKTDVFLERMQYVSDVARRAAAAIALSDKPRALAQLDALEQEVLAPGAELRELHTALLAIYLGYRAKSAFERMITLHEKMPKELRETPIAREQLALAQNRLAERAAAAGNAALAAELRAQALASLDRITADRWTSETFGVLGRIHKGKADADRRAGQTLEAESALSAAIDAYESGFKSDPRDYYPGVNAVTLRIVRGDPEDAAALEALLPVVRFAAERAQAPKNNDEKYWLTATRLELATAGRDWKSARLVLRQLLSVPGTQDFMRETTCKNLEMQASARKHEPETVAALEQLVTALRPHVVH